MGVVVQRIEAKVDPGSSGRTSWVTFTLFWIIGQGKFVEFTKSMVNQLIRAGER